MIDLRRSLFILVFAASCLGLLSSAAGAIGLDAAVSSEPAATDEIVSVSFTVSNDTGSTATNVVVEADVPAGVDAFDQDVTTGAGDCTASGNLNTLCNPGEVVRWSLGTLVPGESRIVTMAPWIGNSLADGSVVSFPGRAFLNGALVASDSAAVEIQSTAGLDLALDASRSPVEPGERVTYTLTFGNAGSTNLTGVGLELPLPAGTSFVSATDGGTETNPGLVEWSLGSLLPGTGGTRQVTVEVDPGVTSGTILSVDAAEVRDAAIPATVGRAWHTAVVTSLAPLTVVASANPDPVADGEYVDVSFTVANHGSATLTGVALESRLLNHLDTLDQDLTTGVGDCTVGGNGNVICTAPERIRWTIGTLAPGESATVTAPPEADFSNSGTVLRFPAWVSSAEGPRADGGVSALALDEPTLALDLRASRSPVEPGEQVTYTLTFGNEGGVSRTGVGLELPLPPGTSVVSVSDGGAETSPGLVEWNLGTLLPGVGGTRKVTVDVDLGAVPGSLFVVDAATLRDAAVPARVARARHTGTVAATAPLTLVAAVNPDPVEPSEIIEVTFTVANRGSETLTGVTLEARLLNHLDNLDQDLTTGAGDCTVGGNGNTNCATPERVLWTLGTLPPGVSTTVTLPPEVEFSPNDGTVLRFPAWASAAEGARAETSASALVLDEPTLDVAIDASRNPAEPGEQITYTLTFGNEGVTSRTGVMLEMPLPPGTSFVSATDGGVETSPGVVTWNVGTLLPGVGGTRRVTLDVDPIATPGSLIPVDAARVLDASFPAVAARARQTGAVEDVSPLTLVAAANPDPVEEGELVEVSVAVANRGATTLTGVTLATRLLDGLDSFDHDLTIGSGDCTVSGNNNVVCTAQELVFWTIGTLAPGQSRTVTMPPEINFGFEDGEILRFPVWASAAEGPRAESGASVLVRSEPTLALAADASPAPVEPGQQLTYTLTFGNEGAVSRTGVVLEMPLPPGTSFVSASGGGAETSPGVVTWPLGTLVPGVGSRRRLTVETTSAVPGQVLQALPAAIRDDSPVPEGSRSTAVVPVESASPLHLEVEAMPATVLDDEGTMVALTVHNTAPFALPGIMIEARLPDGINFFNQDTTTGAGDCTTSGNNNTSCSPQELVSWAIPPLPAGGSSSVAMMPVTSFSIDFGRLIPFRAVAIEPSGSQALAADIVRIGTGDSDGDGVDLVDDNCPNLANRSQFDRGGIGPGSTPDGIGDACQCGDVNDDGVVTGLDGTLVTRASLNLPPFPGGVGDLPAPAKCDVGGPAGCTGLDGTLIKRGSLGLSPGVEQLCPAAGP